MDVAGYRDSHLAPDKGESYHKMFSDNQYRQMVWRFEKLILDRIQASYFAGREICHLDFACGTGRILSHFKDRAAESVGVDVSPSMLEVARRNHNCEIYQLDLTKKDLPGNRRFNLITAFRFFANAEPELRHEAMLAIIKHLDRDGLVVFNNHRNTGCLRYRLGRLFGRSGYEGMSNSEVRTLVMQHGLEIVEIHHLCVFPASEARMLIPVVLLQAMEALLARFPLFRGLAENQVFVCRLC